MPSRFITFASSRCRSVGQVASSYSHRRGLATLCHINTSNQLVNPNIQHTQYTAQYSTMAEPQFLDESKAKELINDMDTFLFDCDGVLWDAHGEIDGSREALLKLKELGKKVFYVTNNSSKSRQTVLDKCKSFGFPATEEEIVTTSYIAAVYLKQIGFQGTVYLMGLDESLGAELNRVGIKYIGTGPNTLNGNLTEWLKKEVNPEVKCVLVGYDPHISYMKIMEAASYLKNPDCLFIGTNLDTNLPAKADVTIPGTGCIVLPVAHASRRQPRVMGKPETLMFEVLQKAYDLDPSRCLMTGDMLSTDIKFASNCGMKSLLVLSGNTTLEDTRKADAPAVPDIYAPCFGEILKHI